MVLGKLPVRHINEVRRYAEQDFDTRISVENGDLFSSGWRVGIDCDIVRKIPAVFELEKDTMRGRGKDL